MRLAVEIGGTKLQLAVGDAAGRVVEKRRYDVDPAGGAAGILTRVENGLTELPCGNVERVGVGFGGPVDGPSGVVVTSHQISGWDGFPLAEWFRQRTGVATRVANDCDTAALAEARLGAGQGANTVFYVTVGSGVGGGFVVGGHPFGGGRPAVAEIGHLRPGPAAVDPSQTVESLASGWGLAAEMRARIRHEITRPLQWRPAGAWSASAAERRQHLATQSEISEEFFADMRARCGNDLESLTAKQIAQAADEGNLLASDVLAHGIHCLGWAIAQMLTLLACERVVVGGGVSLMGETRFFAPLRDAVRTFVFPPLRESYSLVPAQLGEDVVLHGALLL